MARPDPHRFAAARAVFEELIELAAPARARRLAELAQRDAALADAVAGLLAADEAAADFLEDPAAVVAPTLVAAWLEGDETAGAGTRVGAYRLLGLLGRGGMGEVWEAERVDGQFEQRAALKLLKRGMDSDEIVARFLRERQILARLAHPGIARLLDGGRAQDGRPFLVLEKVVGVPITEHCAATRAPIEERLRLLAEACDAVESAHHQLVVHRDLKPSNILVEAGGRVKLLDFGIAKLLAEDEGEERLTRTGLRALTPAYAAPEQILGEPVTTATDVYALGVVLYELLTGRLPHRRSAGSAAALASAVDTEAIERPSSVVRRGEATDPRERRRLERRLRGDLDTIVTTALAREPDRRYPSAAALAEDLRRHLSARPLTARPDTFAYRAAKFVRRHRVGVAAAVVVALALVAGLVGTAWQARRAAANARVAEANARRAERVKEFLIGLFEVADPDQGGGEIPARELLAQAARRLEVELADDPEIRADLLEAAARIDRALGLATPAAALAERALAVRESVLGADHPAVASARATLGAVRLDQGRLDEAAAALARAVATLERVGPADNLTLARVRSDYANILFWQGQLERSLALERQAYEAYRDSLGAGSVQTAIHQRNLGVLLEEMERLDEAERAYRESQSVIERALGDEHPNTAQSHVDLAVLLERRGRYEEAEELFRDALAVREQRLGARHPTTGQSLQLYALFLLNRGRLAESETHYRRALELFRAIDPEHFEVGKCLNGLALIAGRRGDHAGAEAMLREVVARFRRTLGEAHPFLWQATGNLAREIAAAGRPREAEPLQREVVTRLEAISGPETEELRAALEALAGTLRQNRKDAEADVTATRARALAARLATPGH